MADQDREAESPSPSGQTQPGQVISPESTQVPAGLPSPEIVPAAPTEPLQPSEAIPQPLPESPETDTTTADSFKPQDTPTADADGIHWTASEFVNHEKSVGWYLGVALVAIILAVAVYLATKDVVSCGVIIICAIIFGVYGGHKPRELDYGLNRVGFAIGKREYLYDEFRSFSVMPEGAFLGIVFMPLKRFSVPITIYFSPKDQDVILGLLSDRLPFEDHHQDMVDGLLRRIRF